MTEKKTELAKKIYLYLGGLFITSLVVSNLIFQKFFYWRPFEFTVFGNQLFELSVGILPYPITFLITDLISEIYGKKKANQVVIAGIFGRGLRFGLEAILIYLYGDTAMDAATWLLDHELIMALVLILVLGLIGWWFTKKNPSKMKTA